MNEREFMTPSQETSHQAILDGLKTQIGNVTVPALGETIKFNNQNVTISSEIQALVIALEDKLVSTMPEQTGLFGNNILQQL